MKNQINPLALLPTFLLQDIFTSLQEAYPDAFLAITIPPKNLENNHYNGTLAFYPTEGMPSDTALYLWAIIDTENHITLYPSDPEEYEDSGVYVRHLQTTTGLNIYIGEDF